MNTLAVRVENVLEIDHNEAVQRIIGMFVVGILFITVLALVMIFFPWQAMAPQNFELPVTCIQIERTEISDIKLIGKNEFIDLVQGRPVFASIEGQNIHYYLPQDGILLSFVGTFERSDIRYGVVNPKIKGNQATLFWDRWQGWTIFLLILLPLAIELILFRVFYGLQKGYKKHLFFSL